jgi:hypothetical protein
VIHVAFVEQHHTTYAYAVYYRESRDGGATWSAAKNLSEDMVGLNTGRCTVLVDGQNRTYVIWRAGREASFPVSAEPSSRGSPTNLVYRCYAGGQTPGSNASANGMQAFQGPGGRMIALMQMNDAGPMRDSGDTFIALSNGHGWSTPINLTNNAGRSKFAGSQHGNVGSAVETTYGPGPTAAAYLPDGHLALLLITYEQSLFGTTAFGVATSGGSTSTPTLRFIKL